MFVCLFISYLEILGSISYFSSSPVSDDFVDSIISHRNWVHCESKNLVYSEYNINLLTHLDWENAFDFGAKSLFVVKLKVYELI